MLKVIRCVTDKVQSLHESEGTEIHCGGERHDLRKLQYAESVIIGLTPECTHAGPKATALAKPDRLVLTNQEAWANLRRSAMDFFEQQERSRRQTTLLLAYFAAAVVVIILLAYVGFASLVLPFMKPLPTARGFTVCLFPFSGWWAKRCSIRCTT